MESPPAAPRETHRRWWIPHLVIAGLLLANLTVFVLRNAVALPYSDQWELHRPVWANASPWQLFVHQHGPHRQGVFFPPTAAILHATNGDTRIESLWIAGWLAVAAVLAWTLPRRLSGRWHFADAVPLFWCLSLLQYETVVTTPNVSHSIGPLVLTLGAAHALACVSPWWRWSIAGILGAAAVFTGFGIFAGVAVSALALHALAFGNGERRAAGAALLLLAAAWGRFFSDYIFSPAAPGFAFPHYPLADYWPFVTAMASCPHGFHDATALGRVVGSVLLIAGLAATVQWSLGLLRGPLAPRHFRILVLLAGTALLFIANTAVGRVQLGADAGMAPRYISLQIPLAFALFLACRLPERTRWRHHLGIIALGALALWPYRDLLRTSGRCGTWGLPESTLVATEFSRTSKLAWLFSFKETGDLDAATRFSRFLPLPHYSEGLPARVEVLRASRWYPFNAAGAVADCSPFLPIGPVLHVGFSNPEGQYRWLGAEGLAVVDGRERRWANLEIRDRVPGLPTDAPLVIAYAGRSLEIRPGNTPRKISLPLGRTREEVMRFVSPAGTIRPADSGRSRDDRELSFFLREIEATHHPLHTPYEPFGDSAWAPRAAIVELAGFHGWEDGFGWMADQLEVTTESSVPAWLHLVVGDRFPGLAGAGGLRLEIDGVAGANAATGAALSIPLSPGRHYIRLVSLDGARTPRECGYSEDGRPLSYRLTRLEIGTESPAPSPAEP